MTDLIDSLIKEISVKHGIAVSRDDPILILQTLNARLMDENAKTQQMMLNQYKEELEAIALRWSHDTKDKSERILNAALSASKEVMTNSLQECAKTTGLTIKNSTEELLSRTIRNMLYTKRIAMINIAASVLTFLSAITLIFGYVR